MLMRLSPKQWGLPGLGDSVAVILQAMDASVFINLPTGTKLKAKVEDTYLCTISAGRDGCDYVSLDKSFQESDLADAKMIPYRWRLTNRGSTSVLGFVTIDT